MTVPHIELNLPTLSEHPRSTQMSAEILVLFCILFCLLDIFFLSAYSVQIFFWINAPIISIMVWSYFLTNAKWWFGQDYENSLNTDMCQWCPRIIFILVWCFCFLFLTSTCFTSFSFLYSMLCNLFLPYTSFHFFFNFRYVKFCYLICLSWVFPTIMLNII